MRNLHQRLCTFGLWSFVGFLLCAALSIGTGLALIWRDSKSHQTVNSWSTLALVFLSALLLTVVLGLIVSGTRSVNALLRDSKGSQANDQQDAA